MPQTPPLQTDVSPLRSSTLPGTLAGENVAYPLGSLRLPTTHSDQDDMENINEANGQEAQQDEQEDDNESDKDDDEDGPERGDEQMDKYSDPESPDDAMEDVSFPACAFQSNDEGELPRSSIPALQLSQDMIEAIQNAMLEQDLSDNLLNQICNPSKDIDDIG